MLRIASCVIALVASACAFDEDGRLVACFSDCDPGPDPFPPQELPPLSFGFDRGANQATTTLARGGILELEVRANRPETPAVVALGDAISLEVTSEAKRLTRVAVHGDVVGDSSITASIPSGERASLAVSVAELTTVGIALPFSHPTEQLQVLPDIGKVAIYLGTADGKLVLDHSLAIDTGSDPGFALENWDTLVIPRETGDHVAGLTRATGDVHHVGVSVLDHVDAIVAPAFVPGGAAGTVCVEAVAGGAPVATHAWQLVDGHDAVVFGGTTRNCFDYLDALPGATLTVGLAGTTATFVLR